MRALEFIRFEFVYRYKRPASYFFIAFVVFASVLTAISAGSVFSLSTQVSLNAPIVLSKMTAMTTIISIFIASAIMGVAIIRDYEHEMEGLILSNPVTKMEYLSGRFIGAFLWLLISFLFVPLTFLVMDMLELRDGQLLEIDVASYLKPFFWILLPNLFFLSALFFATGALTKRMSVIYAKGVLVFILFSILDEGVIEQMGNKDLALLFDFFSAQSLNHLSKYWTVQEQNSWAVSYGSSFVLNRLIWLGLALILLVWTYLRFKPGASSKKFNSKRNLDEKGVA